MSNLIQEILATFIRCISNKPAVQKENQNDQHVANTTERPTAKIVDNSIPGNTNFK